MRRVWRVKERMRTQRFRGVKWRWRVLKVRAPRRKERIAVRDFVHARLVAVFGRFEIPRAAKMVLPVFGWLLVLAIVEFGLDHVSLEEV